MADNNGQIVLGLDIPKTVSQINADIKKLQNQLDQVKATGALDTSATVRQINAQIASLQSQLNNININANVNVSQTVGQATTQAQQLGQQIGSGVSKGISQSLLRDKSVFKFEEHFRQSGNAAKEAQKYFQELLQNENATVTVLERFDDSKLDSFTVNVKRASGEVESLHYKLRNLGDNENPDMWFAFTGGNTNDLNVVKQFQQIENAFADYTAKFAQFKSTNTNILSGLTQPLTDFEKKLAGLKNGTVSIDEVKNAFKLLGTEASKITENFTGQLSKTDAAIRKLAQGDEIMDKLKASFKGLNNAPKEITKELNSVSKLLQNVKNIESKEGRTANWSAAYRKWADEVDKLQAKLSVLQKQQANMTTPQIFKTSDLRSAGIPYMTKVSNTIEKQMPELQKMLNAYNWKLTDVKGIEDVDGKIKSLTVTVRDAEGALKQFTMQRAKLDTGKNTPNGLMQVGDVKILETASHSYEKISEQVKNIQHLSSTGSFAKQVSDATVEYNKLSTVTDDLKTDFAELQRLQTVLGTSQTDEELISNYEAFNTTLEKVKNNMHVLANEQKQAGTYNSSTLADQKKIDALAESVLKFRDNNTKMSKSLRNSFTGIYDKLISGTELTNKEVKELTQQFTSLKLQVREAGQLGQSFGDKMKNAIKKFSEWGFATGIVTKATSEISKAITELKELDNILTEISKTSDLTEQQLKKLGDTAFESASKYGKKASDYLTGVQEMYRAGFDNAEEMAELSVLAQSAGDMDSTLSNDYIMATNAAYKYKGSVESLNDVLDRQNYITNNAAISMKDIADATTETASVAAQYGVEVDELSALIATATANTRESGAEVGTALKSILINLQDTTSKPVTDTFNALGISMTKVVDGAEQLKTPIELIYELADAYNSLPEGDIMRANILNEIGQKRHAKFAWLYRNI